MTKINRCKTVSCNSNGMVISYGDVNKHQFVHYENEQVKKIQLEGTVKYQKIEETSILSYQQKDIYSKVINGFNAYSNKEIADMSEVKKKDISVTYTRAKRILNNWKQELTFSLVDNLLLTLFPKSSLVKKMCQIEGYLDDVPKKDDISFEELGINQNQIVDKLIEFGLLPSNFYQLT